MGKRLSTEDFIALSKEKHGGKYDYSETIYIKSKSDVDITCPLHGIFSQRASSHLEGYGCKKCAMDTLNARNTLTLDDFVTEAISVHGKKFDYSESVYNGSMESISIRCLKHGVFEQRASSHLEGRGCKTCRDEKASVDNLFTIAEFMKASIDLHGKKYSYEKSVYVDSKTDLILTCNLHGDFLQTPSKNLAGHGCTLCGHSMRGPYKTILYLAYFPNKQLFKIGATADITDRVKTLNSNVGEKPVILNHKVFDKDYIVYLVEKNLLDHMRESYVQCTDSFCGHTECFEVPSEKLHEAEKYIYDFMSSGNHLNKITIPFEGGCNVSN